MIAALVSISKQLQGETATRQLALNVDASRPDDGATALHIAAKLGSITTIRLLMRELTASATALNSVCGLFGERNR